MGIKRMLNAAVFSYTSPHPSEGRMWTRVNALVCRSLQGLQPGPFRNFLFQISIISINLRPNNITKSMKNITLIFALLFCSVAYSQTGSLNILADGFKSDKGQALYLVFENSAGFPKDLSKAYRSGKMSIKNRKAQANVTALPEGIYAVIIVHDEDNSGKLNTNWIGMPKEGVGNSNNAKGMPNFSKSSFSLEGNGFLRISLVYL
jgi:uncharacterized protein (DUF2141 family)